MKGPTGTRNKGRECGTTRALNCDSTGLYFSGMGKRILLFSSELPDGKRPGHWNVSNSD